jgi:hypothetical protein
VYTVIGRDKEGTVDVGKLTGKRAISAGVDVLDQRRPRLRAVARPELLAMFAVIGLEEEGAVDGDETTEIRSRPSRAGVDVLRIGKIKPLFSPRAAAASPQPPARRPRAARRDTMLGAKAPG